VVAAPAYGKREIGLRPEKYAAPPIAVVGMAGVFPGAPDSESFWRLMMEGRDAIRPVPSERWDASAQLDPELQIPGVGGFIDGVDLFDPGFFGISPREAADVDPQQRLLLEACWRALEDAGQRTADLAGSRTGVYVGASWHDYELLRAEYGARPTQHSLVGNALDVLASRVSYFLRLRGPSLTVETGCSSALVALDLAAQALRGGGVDAAIVGAANLILSPDVSVGLTHFGGLSRAGRCAAFAASADGFARGEGVAAVYLKPLATAMRQGDRIHGLIVSTAVNNDGGGESLVTPSQAGQEDLLHLAYTRGGIPPEAVAYVEAHGTGTLRGDPVEAGAIGRVLGQARTNGPIWIGSVKTNIGHLEAAAGMAGLFKVLLSLKHGVVPPTLHAAELNPEIPFQELNVQVAREARPLPASDPVYLGVSSFGWGGTNAHVVVSRPPVASRSPDTARAIAHQGVTGLPAVLPLSAHDQVALVERARQLRGQPLSSREDVRALAGALAWHHDHFQSRAAIVAQEPAELTAGLDAVVAAGSELELPGVLTRQARDHGEVAFVFPGQGGQWDGMGQALYRGSPVFAQTIQRCAEALAPHISWDPLSVFRGDADGDWMSRIDMLQPTLWAMSVGLAELWRACGIEPSIVVGHSQGEIAAATLAGILSYEDAALVIARRSAITRRTCGRGLMLAVDLDRDDATAALEGFEDSIWLAVHNGPGSCVLSGDQEAVLALQELLTAEGTFCRLVNVDYASHSPHMDELREEMLAALSPAVPRQGTVKLMSTMLARRVDGTEMDATYWVDSLRKPVLFGDAMTALFDDGTGYALEISPHPVLTPALERLAADRPGRPAVLPTLRRHNGQLGDFAQALARAYVAGLEPFLDLPAGIHLAVPGYPLRRERYWPPRLAHGAGHGGLDVSLMPVPGEPDAWQGQLSLHRAGQPWLADHQVCGQPVLPGTVMLTLALRTVVARYGRLPAQLERVAFREGITVPDGAIRLAAQWRDDTSDGGSFRLLTLPDGASTWVVNATARASFRARALPPPTFPRWKAATPAPKPAEFYRAWAGRGLDYGPAFRRISSLRRRAGGREALGEVSLGDRLAAGGPPYLPHPALWDGALQVALAVSDKPETLVPVAVDAVRLLQEFDRPVRTVWSHAVRRDNGLIDVHLFDEDRRLLLVMEGLRLLPLPAAEGDATEAEREYRVRWVPAGDVHGTPSVACDDPWVVYGAGQQADELADALSSAGAKVRRAGRDLSRPGDGAPVTDAPALGGARSASGVVFVAPQAHDGLARQRRGLVLLTRVVHACLDMVNPPKISVVTARAQGAETGEIPDPGGALYWGYTRVLQREHGELQPGLIDVDPAVPGWAERCASEVLDRAGEEQVALRRGKRLAARLTRGDADGGDGSHPPVPRVAWQPFRVATRQPGVWEGVDRVAQPRRVPGSGEVEIEVTACALNFVDVMKALGVYPDPEGAGLIGGECAGRVSAVGPDGAAALGDRFVACTFGALASHVTVRAEHARPIPPALSDAEAAALPLAFATAWYGLVDRGRLQAGETVLIHSAAGGVGLAAIQVARLREARIIATAGSEHKREYLRSLGVRDVFDSRDLSWADDVAAATNGRGVDVVLNSLAGAAIPLGLDALAEDGRFIEIGKKDIYGGRAVSLGAFRKGITVTAVDMAGLMTRRPERFAVVLSQVWELVCAGQLRPLPIVEYPYSEAADALRQMSLGQHIGKFVVTGSGEAGTVAANPIPDGSYRADGSYLITGGLGALGLSFAGHLAQHGAGALILIGRSAPTPAAAATVKALREAGVSVRVACCDVSDKISLERTLRQARAGLPPVRGVVHAAGVLADATIANMSAEQITAVLAPKVEGARLLEEALADEPLDFLVLFSSAAALTGNTGQAAYAAANAYLDALAQARRARALPALSVQWGPFAEIGLAAEEEMRGVRLAQRGMGGVSVSEAWPALERMLQRGDIVTAYVQIDLRQWFDANPETVALSSWQWLHDAARVGTAAARVGNDFLAQLNQAPLESRLGLVEAKVRDLAARVLQTDPGRVSPSASFKSLGLDSLLGLELRNRLEYALGCKLSPTLLWTYGNPGALSAALCERLQALMEAE
jgi:acyl transferase domain-containing protein/acyl carrier protein